MASSDGKVVIDVILDDGTVTKGVANIDQKLSGVAGAGKKAATGIMEIVTALGLVSVASKALDMMKQSLDGAIARYDTLSGFPVVMERMGFSTDEARKSIQKLSDGIQGLPTTLDSIVANTQRIALLTGDLGLATDTALALNNAFLASGSSAADAERGLTQYVQMLSKGKVDMESWYTLQETMGYALREVAEAFGFAGSSAQNDLYTALQEGTISFDEFNSKLIELSNVTGGFAEIAKTSTAGIGTSITNMKTDVVKGVTEIIAAIDSVLAETPLKSISNVIDTIGDSFFAVLSSIASLIKSTVGPVQSFFFIFENGVEKIKSAFSEGGVVDLVQVFIELLPQFQQVGMQIIQNIIQGFNDHVQDFTDTAIITVQTYLNNLEIIAPELLKLGTNMIVYLIEGISDNLSNLVETSLKIVTTIVESIISSLPSILDAGIKILRSIIEGIINALPELVNGIAQLIQTVVETIFSMFPEIVTLGVEMVISLIQGILEALPDIIETVIDLLDSLINTILDNLPLFIDAAVEIILALIDGLVKATPKILTALLTIITKLLELIVNNLPEFIGAAVSICLALIEGLVKGTPQIIKAIFEIIGRMALEIVNFDWVGIGKDIVNGLINGLKGMAKDAWEAAKSLGKTIVDGIKSFLDIHSPSRVMMQLGVWIGLGLVKGIESTEKDNQKVIEELGQVLIKTTEEIEKEISKITVNVEKERTKVQQEYASKRENLKKKTAANLEKLEREEKEKIRKINEKAWEEISKLQAKADAEKLKAIQDFIKQKKDLEELSLLDEVRIWEESLKHFKDGTDEKIEAQIAYKKALKSLNDEIVKINEGYSNKIQEVSENLKKREQELTEAYQKAVDDRTKALYSFAGIFDEIQEKADVSGEQLIANLQAQVNTFAEWAENIRKLAERGIDEGLLKELQDLGPKAAAEIKALTKLSDSQLTRYQELWKEKNQLAREQALQELQGLKAETEQNIIELRKSSLQQLDQLHKEWQAAIRSVVTTSDNELSKLKQVGINAGQGLLNGLASMEPALIAKAQEIANAIKVTIQSALQIHSPSRWMRDFIAGNMAKGFVKGVDKYKNLVTGATEKMSDYLKPTFTNRLRGIKPSFGLALASTGSTTTQNTQYSYDQSRKMENNIYVTVEERKEIRELEKTLKRLEYGF